MNANEMNAAIREAEDKAYRAGLETGRMIAAQAQRSTYEAMRALLCDMATMETFKRQGE